MKKKWLILVILTGFSVKFWAQNGVEKDVKKPVWETLEQGAPGTLTERRQIPGAFYSRCEKAGTTILFKYKAGNGERSVVVYLPYGYENSEDEALSQQRYPVLYLMHGGGGAASSYMGPAQSPNQFCWIIDHAIEEGEIKPLIIVCPSDSGVFWSDLRKFLIPAVDGQLRTIADREHRAFGGFSMGSVATWNVFLHDLDLVANFVPMSGDSWVCGSTGGRTFPEKTAASLARADFIEDYSFKIFAATGTNDTAYPNMQPQLFAMKDVKDTFVYCDGDFTKGNVTFYVAKGLGHQYNHTYEYIYNALKAFW